MTKVKIKKQDKIDAVIKASENLSPRVSVLAFSLYIVLFAKTKLVGKTTIQFTYADLMIMCNLKSYSKGLGVAHPKAYGNAISDLLAVGALRKKSIKKSRTANKYWQKEDSYYFLQFLHKTNVQNIP